MLLTSHSQSSQHSECDNPGLHSVKVPEEGARQDPWNAIGVIGRLHALLQIVTLIRSFVLSASDGPVATADLESYYRTLHRRAWYVILDCTISQWCLTPPNIPRRS